MIAFILGREFRLSIAELHQVFPSSECEFANKEFAIFSNIDTDEVKTKFNTIGGTIKAILIKTEIENKSDFLKESIESIKKNENSLSSGKFCFAIGSYGSDIEVFTLGLGLKKELKKTTEINPRFVNKDSNNINAAAYKKERIGIDGTELNILEASGRIFFGETIAFQDVDEYSSRDLFKQRDMQVGMLPPKLAQMMINIAGYGGIEVYDPFCGLGTILIESSISGKKKIYGSDLSIDMVNASKSNTSKFENIEVFRLDAKEIEDVNFLKNNFRLSIVSEGYLGSVMTKGHVTEDKIKLERKGLAAIYDSFFYGLKKRQFKGNIVISFPFWQYKGKYMYFEEIYDILKKYGFIANKLLPNGLEFTETKTGSLLYHRPNQQVGREIFSLRLK